MTTISFVSTFHKPVLDLYGQRFVDSFSKNIDNQVELYLYAEDCMPVTNDPRIHIMDHHATLPKLVAFKKLGKMARPALAMDDFLKKSLLLGFIYYI